MTYRVQWTRAGHFAPEFHDFRYQEAAKHFEGILRELGHQHVRTDRIDLTETTEKR